MASPRNLGFSIHGCRERCPDGIYRGFVCCAQAGHDGPHAVTSGSTEPPYYVIVHEWVTPVSSATPAGGKE